MDEARAVVIGGGVAGASVAYHLTELGWRDVLLVDRSDLTSGSTFHSAGLVGQLRSTVTLTRMMMYGVSLYRRLLDETGADPGWHEVGSLRLASSRERIEELQRLAGWGQTFGLPLETISTRDAFELWPLFDPEGVEGGAYLPTDGYVDPNGLTFALAEGAKRRGATIWTNARVTAIDVSNGHVASVRFDERDPVRTEIIADAGGVGKVIAEWIVEGEPELDVWKMDIRRFGGQYASRRYARDRAYEVYATYYDIHYPNEERLAGRPLKMAPTYGRLAALGAEFGEKAGWERPNWFASNEDDRHQDRRPRGWAGRHWSTAIVTEHLATRDGAGLFDESSFAKLEVVGPRACHFLQRVCANDVDRPVDKVAYTQLLNRRGGIESDVTVTRLAEDRFRIISGTAFGNHDVEWIRKQLGNEEGVDLRDVTGAYGCLGVWGPRAREILTSLTSADLSNDGFPYMSAREIVVVDAPCLAARVTYVGELGWELYASSEFAASLWDALLEAGRPHGLVPAGYRAIHSPRLEKGYRAWGADVTPEDTPLEAGLGFAVAWGKDFLGREALERQRDEGVERRLCCLTLADSHAMCLGNEPVFRDGGVVARVTSGGIGYFLGTSIAFAYLPADAAEAGTALSVEVFGERVEALVVDDPLYDPKGERIRS